MSFWFTLALAVAGTFLLALNLFDLVTKRNKSGRGKVSTVRQFSRALVTLASFAFAYSYLEIVLCCLIKLKTGQESDILAWAVLAIATLPFIVIPVFYNMVLDGRVAKLARELPLSQKEMDRFDKGSQAGVSSEELSDSSGSSIES